MHTCTEMVIGESYATHARREICQLTIRCCARSGNCRGGLKKILEMIHFRLLFLHSYMRKSLYRKKLNSNSYGFFEAIFYPTIIDYWCRYADIISEVDRLNENVGKRRFSILECGAGGEGISEFLNSSRYTIFLLDIEKNAFMNFKSKDAQPIIGDAMRLPFKDHSIDILISCATTEHIPRNVRLKFFTELKRVCKSKIMLHFPLESDDGLFRGKEYDIRFQNTHKQIFGFEEPNTAQHISSSHPRLDEIKKIFPNSRIIGRKNCDVWLKYMILSRKPLVRFLTGLIYCLFWKRKDNSPPFYECITVWSKSRSEV